VTRCLLLLRKRQGQECYTGTSVTTMHMVHGKLHTLLKASKVIAVYNVLGLISPASIVVPLHGAPARFLRQAGVVWLCLLAMFSPSCTSSNDWECWYRMVIGSWLVA